MWCCGCSDSETRPEVAISGVVTLDTVPLTNGVIQFTSTKTGEGVVTNLDSEGRYSLTFPAAEIGSPYEVTVSQPADDSGDALAAAETPQKPRTGGKSVIPRKYSDRTTSGLTATLEANGSREFQFSLTSR